MWATYPHIGTMADITIYKDFFAQLQENEHGLADKGYIGAETLIVPNKRRPGLELSDKEKEENKVCANLFIVYCLSSACLTFIFVYIRDDFVDPFILPYNSGTRKCAHEVFQYFI